MKNRHLKRKNSSQMAALGENRVRKKNNSVDPKIFNSN